LNNLPLWYAGKNTVALLCLYLRDCQYSSERSAAKITCRVTLIKQVLSRNIKVVKTQWWHRGMPSGKYAFYFIFSSGYFFLIPLIARIMLLLGDVFMQILQMSGKMTRLIFSFLWQNLFPSERELYPLMDIALIFCGVNWEYSE
jgi:hypothetical protein